MSASDKDWITVHTVVGAGKTMDLRLRASVITSYGPAIVNDNRGHQSFIWFLGGPDDGQPVTEDVGTIEKMIARASA